MKTNSVLKGNWTKIKRQLQFRYPWLKPGDLNYFDRNENELLNNLQINTGNTRKQLLDEMNIIINRRR